MLCVSLIWLDYRLFTAFISSFWYLLLLFFFSIVSSVWLCQIDLTMHMHNKYKWKFILNKPQNYIYNIYTYKYEKLWNSKLKEKYKSFNLQNKQKQRKKMLIRWVYVYCSNIYLLSIISILRSFYKWFVQWNSQYGSKQFIEE